jgi:hypothetical protein
MEYMALDALAVIQEYYQFVGSSSGSRTTTTTTTKITSTSSISQKDKNDGHATTMTFYSVKEEFY